MKLYMMFGLGKLIFIVYVMCIKKLRNISHRWEDWPNHL